MANIDAKGLKKALVPAGTYGNVQKAVGTVTLPAGAAVGDIGRAVVLPRGAMVLDTKLHILSAAGGGATAITGNLGLVAVDGGKTDQVDADYFNAGLNLNATGLHRAGTNLAPVVLEGDYAVGLTTAGAALVTAVEIAVVVEYIYQGE